MESTLRAHCIIATVTFILSLSASGSAQSETLPATAKPMSAGDIEALYAGKTKVFSQSSMYFAPDKTMKGVAQERPISGRWSVSGNQICLQIKERKDCWKYWRDGDRIFTIWAVRSYGPKLNPADDYTQDEVNHLQNGDLASEKYTQAGGK